MKNITGIDWLSFSAVFDNRKCVEVRDSAYFKCKKEPYHTRNFSEVWSISTFLRDPKNKVAKKIVPFATLCCKPQSSILSERLCTFKLENSLLYTDSWFVLLLMFLDDFSLTNCKISRVDLYRDFQEIDYKGKKSISPMLFLADIAAGKITKKGGARYTMFADSAAGGVYAVTYGSITSGRQVQIYNKSKELREVHDKPYISTSWAAAGFDKSKDTFRIEVRIQKSGLDLFDLETASAAKLSLKHIYDFSIEPVLNGYLDRCAVWQDARGHVFKPFHVSDQDHTSYPYIPRFRAPVRNPNPEHKAKQVLSWAENALSEVSSYSYCSAWHDKTIAILSDFVSLLRETIPDTPRHFRDRYVDTNYHDWMCKSVAGIRHLVRKHRPDFIPIDLFDAEPHEPLYQCVASARP